MKCKDFEKMLYLYRFNELTKAEKNQLDNHLEICQSCRGIKQKIHQQLELINSLKQEPYFDNQEHLAENIVRSIKKSAKFQQYQENAIDKILDLFTWKPVRLALVASILAILGVFIIQEAFILQRMSRMEQRLVTRAQLEKNQTAAIEDVSSQLINILPSANEHVVIDKKLLEQFILSYSELQKRNKLLLKLIEDQAEELVDVSLNDGLTKEEIKKILESEKLIKKVREL